MASMAASSDAQQTKQYVGHVKNRAHQAMMRDAAKARRQAKGRGNGKRYCYNGVKAKVQEAA